MEEFKGLFKEDCDELPVHSYDCDQKISLNEVCSQLESDKLELEKEFSLDSDIK